MPCVFHGLSLSSPVSYFNALWTTIHVEGESSEFLCSKSNLHAIDVAVLSFPCSVAYFNAL